VFVWPQEGPLGGLPANAEIEGTIIAFSDSGSEPRVFAIVEVVTKQAMVVPVSGMDVIAKLD
jgi:hypothetical protein